MSPAAQSLPRDPTPRSAICLTAVVIALGALLAYRGSLDAPFVFDDAAAIEKNPTIRQLWPPWPALSPPADGAGVVGRPLVNLSLAFNYALGKTFVRGYHVFNLTVHLLAGLALFGVVRRSLLPPSLGARFGASAAALSLAAVTALLWVVHPLQTESVITVVQRNELLVSLFYLLALYAVIRASGSTAPRFWSATAIAACWLGVASKEVIVSAPLIIFLYDRTFLAGTFREAWRRRWPTYLGLASSWVLLGCLALSNRQRAGTVGFGLGVDSWDYLLTQCRAVAMYLKLALWPHPLVLDYGTDVVTHATDVLPQAFLLVALAAGTVIALWRRPMLGFLGAAFFAILAPSSSIVPLTTQTMAEHRMYLPLAVVIVLAVVGLQRWLGRFSLVVCLVLATALAVASAGRADDYRSLVAIWSDTVAHRPNNPRAHLNLGFALAQSGQSAEAIPHYTEALRLKPAYAEAHYSLANALRVTNHPDEALAHYEQALQLQPKYPEAHNNWGNALLQLRRLPEAREHYAAAVQLAPDYAEAHSNLGLALFRAGQIPEALVHYTEALRLNPNLADAHQNLANALAQTGRAAEALDHYAAADRLQPASASVHYNWGLALLDSHRPSEAIEHFETALHLAPGYPQAREFLDQARREAAAR